MVVGTGRDDGLVGFALLRGLKDVAAFQRGVGSEAGGVKDLHEAAWPEPQRAHDGQPFPVHSLDHARHRGREGLAVEQQVARVLLDPGGVPYHARRVHDGVDVGQARLQHVLRRNDVGEHRGDLGQDLRTRLRGEGRAPEVGGAPVDLHPRCTGHAADAGEGDGFTAANRDAASRAPQLVHEVQAAAGLSGVEVYDLVAGQERRQGVGHELVGYRGSGDGDEIHSADGLVQGRSDEVGLAEGLPAVLHQLDAASSQQRLQGLLRTGIETGLKTADGEVRGGGAPAVAGSEDCNFFNSHD